MSDRDDMAKADTQQPWDRVTERRSIVSTPACPAADEALRETRALHRSMHGEGAEQGVFERFRSMSRSQDEMAHQLQALELRVESFDHKLDETLRVAKEELRIAKEQAARQPPMWMQRTKLASIVTIAAFFLTRLWHEIGR